MELPELFGELRSLLSQPPEEGLWWRIEHALGRFEDDDLLEQVVAPYLLEQFKRAWPSALERPALVNWYSDDLAPSRKRALGTLATAPCPYCKRACSSSEVSRALKLQYGKRYAKTVRLRDVMTLKNTDTMWLCDTCRTFTCHLCQTDHRFDALVAAVARCYPNETHEPLDMAREIARRMTDREWVCEGCLDSGYVVTWTPEEPEPHKSQDDEPGPWNDPFRDRTIYCKECYDGFVFTVEEQRAWYEQYGIPRYYHGTRGSRVPIVRRRCDACQRGHVARKRIGKILSGRASNLEYAATHRELEELYATLGNANKAGYHRNIARRLEGGDD